MKIILFQYNRATSAIFRQDHLAATTGGDCLPVNNRFLASGFADRLLREDTAALRPAGRREYAICGNWQ